MKRVALLLALAATLALAVVAAAAPPPVDAEAYLVQNSGTGEVLASSDEHERLPMASITKLMTAIVALERASLDDVATISRFTASIGESTINLVPGERVTLRDLIRAALIQSANDAANAIAAFVGRGSVGRFVELMNARARQLGLDDTHFANPDGLDAPGHYSSAADVTKLARVAMNKPFIRETVGLATATAAGRPLRNWNDLLSSFPNLIGVKTGHTERRRLVAGRGRPPRAASRSTRPCSAARPATAATPTCPRCSRGGSRATGRSGRSTASASTAPRAPRTGRIRSGSSPRSRRCASSTSSGRCSSGSSCPSRSRCPSARASGWARCRSLDRGTVVARSPLVAANAVEKPGALGRVGFYAGRTLDHLGGLFS